MDNQQVEQSVGQVGENGLELLTQQFQGEDVFVFYEEGRPWLIANQIGRILGYGDNGNELCKIIARRWKKEVKAGTDRRTAKGQKLQKIKDLEEARVNSTPAYQRSVSPFASQALMLSESGVYMVCLKSGKPLGEELRRWLADEALPAFRMGAIQIVDLGAELPPAPQNGAAAALEARRQHQRALREMRLKERKQAEEERQAQHERDLENWRANDTFLVELASNPEVDPRLVMAQRLVLMEQRVGGNWRNLMGTDPRERWWRPTDIAKMLGISRNLVGRMITKADIRDDPRYCKRMAAPGIGNQNPQQVWLYNALGVDKIKQAYEEHLAEGGDDDGEDEPQED